MNDGNDGPGRPRRAGSRRAAVLPAALAGIALLIAACGGGGSSSGAASMPYQQAVAYAQCMRSHGEPGFPDPDSQGNFVNLGPVSDRSTQYLSANRACGHLLPSHPGTAAQRSEHVSQALKYSACMRSHGIANFPDPIVAQGGIAVGFRLSGIDQSSAQFQSAQQACRKFEPGLGGAP